jgi:glycosyltransferase involved in cell wall biosynthesis
MKPKKKTISLCMIVLNEEQFLAYALKNVHGYVDEIIVVDGGSKDGTVAIAKQFGAKVYSKKWADHYGNQRNHSLSKATKEWILIMDADETHESKLLKSLQKFANNQLGIDMFAFPRKNYLDGKQTAAYPDRQYRFFKRSKTVKFHGRIHEKPQGFDFEACPRFVNIIHKKTTKRQARQSAYYKHLAEKYDIEPQKSFYRKQLKPGLPFTKK